MVPKKLSRVWIRTRDLSEALATTKSFLLQTKTLLFFFEPKFYYFFRRTKTQFFLVCQADSLSVKAHFYDPPLLWQLFPTNYFYLIQFPN